MNKHSSIKSAGSLLERASEIYDFGAALRGGSAPFEPSEVIVEPAITQPVLTPVAQATVAHKPMAARPASNKFAQISRERLAANNFIVPDGDYW